MKSDCKSPAERIEARTSRGSAVNPAREIA